ncbi:MAG: F0F1 ATP synthase subunit A [Acidobacteriota bacterium]|jgi:F-type H+-transporting ATPase subunit a
MHELQSLVTLLFNHLTGLHAPDYMVGFGLIMILTLVVGYTMTRRLSVEKPGVGQQILELTVETVGKFLDDIIGKNGRNYMPIIGTFTILILVCNLSGQIPGFMPPTGSIMVTLALSLCSFVAYNWYGIRTHGFSYIKHFMGPVLWLAFLFLPIELVSHLARPMSLAIRLFGNIFGDHQVGGVFLHLVPVVVPVPFMLLGIFVAFVQTLVFVLLSIIYIAGAVEHH